MALASVPNEECYWTIVRSANLYGDGLGFCFGGSI